VGDFNNFDLAAVMCGLYESGNYFASIPPRKTSYEEDYWGEIVDPDGKRRDRSTEREMHLEDIAAELAFANSLPGGRVLDIGCGLGWLLSGLDEKWEKHGIELSVYAADRAGQYAKLFAGPLLAYQCPEASFDQIGRAHV